MLTSRTVNKNTSPCTTLYLSPIVPPFQGSVSPATELEAVEPVEELVELTMLPLLLLAALTPPVLALLWLLLFQPSLLARCLGLCSRM